MTIGNGNNTGIQVHGGYISADVVAVGNGAQAMKTVRTGIDPQDLMRLLGELRDALMTSIADPQTRAILGKDVETIAGEARKPEPDRDLLGRTLATLSDKIKLLGNAVTGTDALIGALKKISQALGFVSVLV